MGAGNPQDKRPSAVGAEEAAAGSSPFARDTLPPTPDKAKVIEEALSGDALPEQKFPSWPPPDGIQVEKIIEGVDYRLVDPTRSPRRSGHPRPGALPAIGFESPAPAPSQDPLEPAPSEAPRGDPNASWNGALAMREEALRRMEQQLLEKENRLLEREMVLGGRARLLDERDEKLKNREIRLRDWEARLMDREASLKEREHELSSQPPRAPTDAPHRVDAQPPPRPVVAEPPRVMHSVTGNFKIEITPGGGGWELRPEADRGSGGKP